MKNNEDEYKCYSTKERDFLFALGFKSWDRARDWNTDVPCWYFKHDKNGHLSEALTFWSKNKNVTKDDIKRLKNKFGLNK